MKTKHIILIMLILGIAFTSVSITNASKVKKKVQTEQKKEPVEKKKDVLINYLAKYVTKNEIELTHLPWHCSRDVSRLCTSINYDNEDEDFYYDKLPYEAEHYQIKVEEYFSTAAFKFRPKDEIFSDLDFVNEMIYNSTL